MRTLEQIRAEFSWERVNAVSPEVREKYRNLAKSLPALVMTSGLMQTLAFLQAKADNRSRNEHGQLLAHVLAWLTHEKVTALNARQAGFAAAMTALAGMDSLDYQRANEETLAILRWIRHFADTIT